MGRRGWRVCSPFRRLLLRSRFGLIRLCYLAFSPSAPETDQRQMADDLCALVAGRVQFHPAAVKLDETLDQGKAEADTPLLALFELVEHPVHVFGGDADTRVGHGNLHFRTSALGRQTYDATLFRVLERVGQEIENRLLDAPRIHFSRLPLSGGQSSNKRMFRDWARS